MENPSAAFSDPDVISNVCALLHGACRLTYSNENDDPLGLPERTLTINDDWTVTPESPLSIIRYDSEDDVEDDDERSSEDADRSEDDLSTADGIGLVNDDDNDYRSFKKIDHFSLLRSSSPTDSEDQVVPSKPLSATKTESTENKNEKFLGKDEEPGERDSLVIKNDAIITEPEQNNGEIGNRKTPKPP